MKVQPIGMLAIVIAACGFLASAEGATITWGAATLITGDSDVITDGTLVVANDISTNSLNPTVNGVTFVSGTGSTGFSSFYAVNDTAFGSDANAPFSALSSSYRDLLRSGLFDFSTTTLTLSGLTIGDSYKFQVWKNESTTDGIGRFGNVVAGNSVTLDHNNTDAAGGVGQFVVGTFVANATTQAITFSGGDTINLANAYQLRDVTVAAPEPASAMLAMIGMVGLIAARRRRRR